MNVAFLAVCLFWCAVLCPAHAQINKGQKLAAQRQYEAALEAFKNDLERPTSKPIALAGIARIYADDRYPKRDLFKAYQFASRALREFEQRSSGDKKKIQNKGEDQLSLSKLQKDVLTKAYQKTLQSNQLAEYNAFLETFQTTTTQQRAALAKRRDQLAYDQAEAEGSYTAFQQVWDQYHKTIELHQTTLYKKLQRRLLESYVEEKGWRMYFKFETLYPGNIYVREGDRAYEFISTQRKNTVAAYSDFIRAYPRSPFVTFARDGLYQLVMATEDLEAYDEFVRRHNKHEEMGALWKRFYALYRSQRGPASVQDFAKAYPDYPFPEELEADQRQVQTGLEQPFYDQIVATEDVLLILDFLQQYPQSPYVAKLEVPFYKSLVKNPLLRGTQAFLKAYPRSVHYDDVLALHYNSLAQDGELGTLNQFMMEHPEYKNIERQQKDLELAETGAALNLKGPMPEDAAARYENYIQAAAPKERAWVALQRCIAPDLAKGDHKAALATVQRLAPHFGPSDPRITQLQSLLIAPVSSPAQLVDLSQQFNQKNMRLCDVAMDHSRLIFSTPKADATYALWEAQRKGQEWLPPRPLEVLEQLAASGAQLDDLSYDQQVSFWSIVGEDNSVNLWYAHKKETEWMIPTSLEPFGKQPSSQSDGYLSAGGQALLFASDATQGVLHHAGQSLSEDFHGSGKGNWDLFVKLRNAKGQWTTPINLGDVINTPYEERHPFLHPDGKTLYFCSDGHGGMGRLDVYRCTRLDDTWTQWSTPENLGASFNSPDNDFPQAVSLDGQWFYWMRQSADEKTLTVFEATLPKAQRASAMTLTPCQVQTPQGAPLSATVAWQADQQTSIPYHHQTTSGMAQLPTAPKKHYRCWVNKSGYWAPAHYFHAGTLSETLTLIAYPVSQLSNHKLVLLHPASTQAQQQAEVARLADFLKKEQITLLLPQNQTAQPGLLSAQAVERLLIDLGCPKKYLSWYSPQEPFEGSTGLLVGFE